MDPEALSETSPLSRQNIFCGEYGRKEEQGRRWLPGQRQELVLILILGTWSRCFLSRFSGANSARFATDWQLILSDPVAGSFIICFWHISLWFYILIQTGLAFLPSLLCAAHSLYSVWVIYPCSLRLLNTESLLDTCSVFQANGIKNNATEVELKISAQKIKAKVHEVPRHPLDSLPVHSLFRGMGRTFTIHQKLLCGLEQWPYFLCLMAKMATGKEASQIREGQGGNLVS